MESSFVCRRGVDASGNVEPRLLAGLPARADAAPGQAIPALSADRTLEAERLPEPDLALARTIQSAVLPSELPSIPGFALSGFCRSAMEVGGDFYDAVSSPSGGVYLAMADVMGCGLPAALVAAKLRTLFRSIADNVAPPAQVLHRLNELMFDELSMLDTFATFQIVEVDWPRRRLVMASAGHCPLLLAEAGRRARFVTAEGLPLGIQRDSVYGEECLPLTWSTCALLYTDGVVEACNPWGKRFGDQRLALCLEWALRRSAPQPSVAAQLLAALNAFEGRRLAHDDQTLLALTPVTAWTH